MRRSQEEIDAHIKNTWDEFWLPLFEREIGAPVKIVGGIGRDKIVMLDARFAEQLKKELTDYYDILQDVKKVYCDLTGGQISKPNTMAVHVISEAEEHRQYWNRQDIKEWIEFAEAEFAGHQITEVIKSLKEHFNIVACSTCTQEAEELRVVGPDHRNTADYSNNDNVRCPDCDSPWPPKKQED